MSPLVVEEFNKLTKNQKDKFRELEAWQNQTKTGHLLISDGIYEQILKWAKASEE